MTNPTLAGYVNAKALHSNTQRHGVPNSSPKSLHSENKAADLSMFRDVDLRQLLNGLGAK